MMMGIVVYVLCALTAATCAAMLWQGYRRTGVRLLRWSALCFGGFAINNALLIVNVRILPEQDLSIIRSLPSLIGISLLLYGLIWESDR